MDPDAALAELRALADTILDLIDSASGDTGSSDPSEEPAVDLADASRFAELVQALDGWICAGGFLPRAWAAGRGR